MSATVVKMGVNWCAERLIIAVPPVSPDMSCQAVADMLIADPAVPARAVVENNRPVALISRQDFLIVFSQAAVRAAFERETIGRFMQSPYMSAKPLIVDAGTGIDALQELVSTAKPRAMADGFIITRNGEYAGLGSGLALLNMSLEQSRIQIATLEEARIAAQKASQAKSTFLASVSHELRTPLNAVIGFSEILQKQFYGPLNDKQTECITDVLRAGTHLLEVINEILDLSKAEAGKLDLHEEEVDLNSIVIQAVRMLRPGLEAKSIAATAELPYRSLRVMADRQKLKQVMINLMSNAAKYTPAGKSVRASASLGADGAPQLIVQDSGIGIASDELDKMLLPFERSKSKAAQAQEGTGIGLPLSKAIIERHGGKLELSSELGSGTTVTIRLPKERLRFAAVAPEDDDSWREYFDSDDMALSATG